MIRNQRWLIFRGVSLLPHFKPQDPFGALDSKISRQIRPRSFSQVPAKIFLLLLPPTPSDNQREDENNRRNPSCNYPAPALDFPRSFARSQRSFTPSRGSDANTSHHQRAREEQQYFT